MSAKTADSRLGSIFAFDPSEVPSRIRPRAVSRLTISSPSASIRDRSKSSTLPGTKVLIRLTSTPRVARVMKSCVGLSLTSMIEAVSNAMVSNPSLPSRTSVPKSENPTSAARRSLPLAPISTSLPMPPNSLSLSLTPLSLSFPSMPSSRSLPLEANTKSRPPRPKMVSSPAPVSILSL
jgi:hypothetical protein